MHTTDLPTITITADGGWEITLPSRVHSSVIVAISCTDRGLYIEDHDSNYALLDYDELLPLLEAPRDDCRSARQQIDELWQAVLSWAPRLIQAEILLETLDADLAQTDDALTGQLVEVSQRVTRLRSEVQHLTTRLDALSSVVRSTGGHP